MVTLEATDENKKEYCYCVQYLKPKGELVPVSLFIKYFKKKEDIEDTTVYAYKLFMVIKQDYYIKFNHIKLTIKNENDDVIFKADDILLNNTEQMKILQNCNKQIKYQIQNSLWFTSTKKEALKIWEYFYKHKIHHIIKTTTGL